MFYWFHAFSLILYLRVNDPAHVLFCFFSFSSRLKAKNAFVGLCAFFLSSVRAELGIWGKSVSVVSLAALLFLGLSPTVGPCCIVLSQSRLSCKVFSCLQSSSTALPPLSWEYRGRPRPVQSHCSGLTAAGTVWITKEAMRQCVPLVLIHF